MNPRWMVLLVSVCVMGGVGLLSMAYQVIHNSPAGIEIQVLSAGELSVSGKPVKADFFDALRLPDGTCQIVFRPINLAFTELSVVHSEAKGTWQPSFRIPLGNPYSIVGLKVLATTEGEMTVLYRQMSQKHPFMVIRIQGGKWEGPQAPRFVDGTAPRPLRGSSEEFPSYLVQQGVESFNDIAAITVMRTTYLALLDGLTPDRYWVSLSAARLNLYTLTEGYQCQRETALVLPTIPSGGALSFLRGDEESLLLLVGETVWQYDRARNRFERVSQVESSGQVLSATGQEIEPGRVLVAYVYRKSVDDSLPELKVGELSNGTWRPREFRVGGVSDGGLSLMALGKDQWMVLYIPAKSQPYPEGPAFLRGNLAYMKLAVGM